MLNNKKYLHVISSMGFAGFLKAVLNKGVQIAYPMLNLATGCLPKNLSKEEYIRCKQHELWDFGDGGSFNLFGANLSKYDGIVVWHSVDVESMLVLGMIASCYNGKIYHIDVSETFSNQPYYYLSEEELSLCLNSYKELSSRQRNALKRKYDALPYETPCIKRYVSKHFEIVDKEVLKKELLKYVKTKPQSWLIPSSYAIAKSRLGGRYYPTFWDCLTLELICEGRAIISEMEFKPRKGCECPLGCCLTTPYLYNGFDLRKLYSFKYFKTK
ncbi:hypothetical protein [uncultured Muribaculum sp.]|uniref:hypothetical protein n=1 Tax=uncultured Muribaculum sp. TaxID=1918613 RepID=UPI0025B0FD44|nr:hypothetical protein [uncultured Muribaculum sp.]